LNSFIRHADVVKIANLAQIVNVIAPIHTCGDELLLHTIYYPFGMYAARRDGVALQAVVKGPVYTSRSYGDVNTVDVSAILGDGVLHVFLVNRSLGEVAPVTIDLAGAPHASLASAELVTGAKAQDRNTYPKGTQTGEQPGNVRNQPFNAVSVQNGEAGVELPPLSIAALSFKIVTP
jgi:alpha-N-arabinofuranosidase